jgi:hypothetical protein
MTAMLNGNFSGANETQRFRKGADGVVNRKLRFAMRFETSRVVDHPVCGASVASQLFVDAAATPPLQGGEKRQTEPFVAGV